MIEHACPQICHNSFTEPVNEIGPGRPKKTNHQREHHQDEEVPVDIGGILDGEAMVDDVAYRHGHGEQGRR